MFKKKVSGSKAILVWAKRETQDYPDVHLFDLSVSWVNGLALCALMHTFAGDEHIPYDDLKADDENDFKYNLELAFKVAESNFNIFRILDVEDMLIKPHPDEKSVQTYLASVYNALKTRPKKSTPIGLKKYKEMLEEKKKQEELEKLVCGICHMNLPEDKKDVVELSSLNFHEKCFHCYECRKKLDDEYCEYQKMPFCMKCGQKAMEEDLQVNRKKFARSHSVNTQMQEKNDLGHHNFSRLGKSTNDLFRDPNPPEKKESPLNSIASKFLNPTPTPKPKENPNSTPKPNFKLTRKLSLFIPGEEDHLNKPINTMTLKEFTKNIEPKPKETKPVTKVTKTVTKVTKVVKNESPLTKKVVNSENPPKKTPTTERPTLTKSKLSTSVTNLNSMLDVLMSPTTKNEGGSKNSLLDLIINPVTNETPKTQNESPKTENETPKTENPITENETPKTENETPKTEEVIPQNETEPQNTEVETKNESTTDIKVEIKVETSETNIDSPSTPEKKQTSGSTPKKIKLPNCPSCKIPLDIEGEKFKCSSCGKTMKRKVSTNLNSTTDLGSSTNLLETSSTNVILTQPIIKKASTEILSRGSGTPKTIKIPNCPTCKVKLETEGEKFKCPTCSKLFNRKN